jgi:5-methylcytosine-specific restriction endonuclease McrA
MYRSCAKCGKIHPTGQRCNIGRTYIVTDESKLRSRYAWTKKSEEIRERAHHLCEVCKDQGQITYDNLEVHHIIKLKDDRGGLLDNENLICLCQEHHKKADREELSSSYLRKLAKDREQGQT